MPCPDMEVEESSSDEDCEIDEANNIPKTLEAVVQCMLEDLRNGCTSEL